MPAGTRLNLLTGLGERLRSAPAESPAAIGGGVGVPPLYGLCQALVARASSRQWSWASTPRVRCSTRTGFAPWEPPVTVTTADGSYGRTGFVTDAMDGPYSYFYACGPLPMLQAIERAAQTPGQYSMEERMVAALGPVWAAPSRPGAVPAGFAKMARCLTGGGDFVSCVSPCAACPG